MKYALMLYAILLSALLAAAPNDNGINPKLCRNFPMPKPANLLSTRLMRFSRPVPPGKLKEAIFPGTKLGNLQAVVPAPKCPLMSFFAAYKVAFSFLCTQRQSPIFPCDRRLPGEMSSMELLLYV